jgi:hypothetical protein
VRGRRRRDRSPAVPFGETRRNGVSRGLTSCFPRRENLLDGLVVPPREAQEGAPMSIQEEQRKAVVAAAQGAMSLNLAFIGVSGGLFDALAGGPASTADLAARAGADHGYVLRWSRGGLRLRPPRSRRGRVLFAHRAGALRSGPPRRHAHALRRAVRARRAHGRAHRGAHEDSGERPGEKVLAERPAILPWFGPMLESSFGALLRAADPARARRVRARSTPSGGKSPWTSGAATAGTSASSRPATRTSRASGSTASRRTSARRPPPPPPAGLAARLSFRRATSTTSPSTSPSPSSR